MTALAKATQNPVADLVSMPFQFNFRTAGGLGDQTLLNINFQPVMPVKGVFKNWTMILRTIFPYLSVPVGGGNRQSGLGDIQEQIFFTPAKASGLIWGIGPIFSFPTATVSTVRTGAWAVGPTVVLLATPGSLVLGLLANNRWTFADEGGPPEVNQFFIQPFLNINFSRGWAMSISPEISANWDAPSGDQWTVPLGMGVTRTIVFGGRPMTLGAHYYHNVTHPNADAADLLRFSLSLLFPSTPKLSAVP